MKRLIVVLAVGGAAVWAAVALATPSSGQTSTILSLGSLQGDVAYNTGLAAQASGLTWNGRQYSADQLPEFLRDSKTAVDDRGRTRGRDRRSGRSARTPGRRRSRQRRAPRPERVPALRVSLHRRG